MSPVYVSSPLTLNTLNIDARTLVSSRCFLYNNSDLGAIPGMPPNRNFRIGTGSIRGSAASMTQWMLVVMAFLMRLQAFRGIVILPGVFDVVNPVPEAGLGLMANSVIYQFVIAS